VYELEARPLCHVQFVWAITYVKNEIINARLVWSVLIQHSVVALNSSTTYFNDVIT